MSRPLVYKIVVTGALALFLMIPLGAIRGLVQERLALRDGVVEDIQRSSVGRQTLAGPFLVIPYRRTTFETTTDESGKSISRARHQDGQLRLVAEELSIATTVDTEERRRGTYTALLYQSRGKLTGRFSIPARFGVVGDSDVISHTFGPAYLDLGVADPRGIKGRPVVSWTSGTTSMAHELHGGTRTDVGPGVHAALGSLPTTAGSFAFAIDLDLAGAEAIALVPAGKETTVSVRSSWPHPSFTGRFLPATRTITDHGFEATWRTSRLASNIESALAAREGRRDELRQTAMGVSFIEPVDIYLQTERSAKYGFLFILFTFILFALHELLGRLAIHPVQYALVGVALAMFFLLLVALSEHLPFAVAYAAASAACILLLGYYVRRIPRSVARGAGFAAVLSALYGALYVLLRSEDTALLLGASLIFVILAAIMVITRRVDWYQLTAAKPGFTLP